MSLLVTQKREECWTLLSIKLVEGCLQTYNGCRRDVKQMLLPRDLSVKGVDRSYLCRKSCFASLDKIINHEKNIAELTAEVKQIRQDFLKNVERLSSIGQTTVHNIPSCHGWLCTSSNSICFIEKFTTHYSYNCSFTESHCIQL